MQAVILVGGFGTRMRPLTNTRPKPLIPFANEPLLVHTMRRLAAGGVTELILSTGYLPENFEELVPLEERAILVFWKAMIWMTKMQPAADFFPR